MLTFSPSNQEGISGFVSKELFQSLLKLGITILIISIALNRTVMNPPVIVDIFNLFLMLTYFFSLMMVEKLHLNLLMRIAMSSTALTFFVLVLFHPVASIWLIIIPCTSFALFGAREGFQWALLGFIYCWFYLDLI